METTILINMNDVLHYSTISANIDPYKINPIIHSAEILYLEPILGSTLYDKLIDLVSTGEITGSTWVNYNTLLINYVTPSVVYHTLELFIPLNSFEIADGGTFRMTPSNAEYSPLNDIDRIVSKYKIIGDKFDDKLVKYLCKNSSLFTEYNNNTGLVGKTETTNRAGSWYLGTNNTKSKIRI